MNNKFEKKQLILLSRNYVNYGISLFFIIFIISFVGIGSLQIIPALLLPLGFLFSPKYALSICFISFITVAIGVHVGIIIALFPLLASWVFLSRLHSPFIIKNSTVRLVADAFEIYFKEKNIEYKIEISENTNSDKKINFDDVEILLKQEARVLNFSCFFRTGIKVFPFNKKAKNFNLCKDVVKIINKIVLEDEYKAERKLIKLYNKGGNRGEKNISLLIVGFAFIFTFLLMLLYFYFN